MPTIYQLIAQVESQNQPAALRFESGWKYATPDLIEKCRRAHAGLFMSRDTAEVLCKTSWGAYQIMGSVLYEQGYTGTFVDYLNSTGEQYASFMRYLRARGIVMTFEEVMVDKAKRERFAVRYNGSVQYADRMLNIGKGM